MWYMKSSALCALIGSPWVCAPYPAQVDNRYRSKVFNTLYNFCTCSQEGLFVLVYRCSLHIGVHNGALQIMGGRLLSQSPGVGSYAAMGLRRPIHRKGAHNFGRLCFDSLLHSVLVCLAFIVARNMNLAVLCCRTLCFMCCREGGNAYNSP